MCVTRCITKIFAMQESCWERSATFLNSILRHVSTSTGPVDENTPGLLGGVNKAHNFAVMCYQIGN